MQNFYFYTFTQKSRSCTVAEEDKTTKQRLEVGIGFCIFIKFFLRLIFVFMQCYAFPINLINFMRFVWNCTILNSHAAARAHCSIFVVTSIRCRRRCLAPRVKGPGIFLISSCQPLIIGLLYFYSSFHCISIESAKYLQRSKVWEFFLSHPPFSDCQRDNWKLSCNAIINAKPLFGNCSEYC